MKEFQLPDGTIAETVQDIDKYLKSSKMAMSSDYSSEYIQNARYQKEKVQRADMFEDFVRNYKKVIWK